MVTNVYNRKRTRGFTLLELIIVVTIIGLLLAIFVSYLGQAREKSRDTARYKQALEILNALELYYTSYGRYPAGSGVTPVPVAAIGSDIQAYLSSVPSDPTYAQAEGYHYCVSTDQRSIALLINTENDAGASGSNFCAISRGPKAYLENYAAGTGVCDYTFEAIPLDSVDRCVARIQQ